MLLWLSARPLGPLKAQHPSPGSLDFKSGHPGKEALPAVRCLLGNTGELCRVFPSLPRARGKLYANRERQKPSTAPGNPRGPASPPTPPPRACSAGGERRAGGTPFFHMKPTPALKPISAADCPGRVGRPTFSRTELLHRAWIGNWMCRGAQGPGPERPEGNAPKRQLD